MMLKVSVVQGQDSIRRHSGRERLPEVSLCIKAYFNHRPAELFPDGFGPAWKAVIILKNNAV